MSKRRQVIATAERTRVAIVRELILALRQRGEYTDAIEELTPMTGDLSTVVPVAAAAISTIAWPSLWQSFLSGVVGPYSLTSEAWQDILTARTSNAVRKNEVNDIKAALRK